MVPFQTAYPMILFMIFLILAGNTGFVSFLFDIVQQNDKVVTLMAILASLSCKESFHSTDLWNNFFCAVCDL